MDGKNEFIKVEREKERIKERVGVNSEMKIKRSSQK